MSTEEGGEAVAKPVQKAKSFDAETIKKILKGLALAMCGGAALAGLDFVGTIEISNPLLAQVAAVVIPAVVNAVREYFKGD